MKATIRSFVNRINAAKSTGPVSLEGKQRASLNAFKHGLTGNRMILQPHEHEAYNRLREALTRDFEPATEQERQLLQKLIDCHTRLNRIAALDSNILNFSLTRNETDAAHDDALESIAAQCRAWIQNADSFDKLGRYESRISRQLLQYTAELERIQKERRYREHMERCAAERAAEAEYEDEDEDDDPEDDAGPDDDTHSPTQPVEAETVDARIASFRQTAASTPPATLPARPKAA